MFSNPHHFKIRICDTASRNQINNSGSIITLPASMTETMLWVRIIGVLCRVRVHAIKFFSYCKSTGAISNWVIQVYNTHPLSKPHFRSTYYFGHNIKKILRLIGTYMASKQVLNCMCRIGLSNPGHWFNVLNTQRPHLKCTWDEKSEVGSPGSKLRHRSTFVYQSTLKLLYIPESNHFQIRLCHLIKEYI